MSRTDTPARVRIGPADRGRRMTLDEFRDADEEEGYLYELARGVLEVTEVPDDPHGQIEDNLREAIASYRREHPGLIRRCGGGSSARLWIPGMVSGRNPDMAIIFEGAPRDDRGRLRPAWAAEIVSEGREARERDYREKREDYLTFGLGEYWIIDPEERRVAVLARREGSDGPRWEERSFAGDEVIVGDLLPGFVGTVAGLWAGAGLDGDDD